MNAQPKVLVPPTARTAEVVSLVELNRARSHRVLDRCVDDAPSEAHPWAYVFPRPTGAARF